MIDPEEMALLSADVSELSAGIRRTTSGVPHIRATSIEGAAFGVGYVQAEDHLCLLAEAFVRARSERALYFGPGDGNRHIVSDFSYKAMRVLSEAEAAYPALDAPSKALVDGFTAGYNHYLRVTASTDHPPQCAGQPWVRLISPQDLLAYYTVIGQYASGDLFVDGAVFAAVPPGVTIDPVVVNNDQNTAGLPRSWDVGDIKSQWSRERVSKARMGSNAWGVGGELTPNGRGALLANPHFPYTGARRFYQFHLTVPGYVDVNGAGLIGTALPLIGFNQHLGWSHTVSTGQRFTAYALTLSPDNPLIYIKDGEERSITQETFTIQVNTGTGVPVELQRDFYFSEYGPMLPADQLTNNAVGPWGSDNTAYTYRDANASISRFLSTWLSMARATDLDAFQQTFKDCGNTFWTNTIYADDQGNAWYIDSSAVPDLSEEALQSLAERRAENPLIDQLADSGFTVLDGSTSRDDWLDSGCDGIAPYEKRPSLLRTDFVQNANDSHWSTNTTQPLEEYSPLFGAERQQLSARTRQSLKMAFNRFSSGSAATSPAGQDGRIDEQDLLSVIWNNRSFYAETLLPDLLNRCERVGGSVVNHQEGASRTVIQACESLVLWDGLFNIDSIGAHVFRLFMIQIIDELDSLYLDPFDYRSPVSTPAEIDDEDQGRADDPLLIALARAADIIESNNIDYQATLGSLQVYQPSGGVPPGGEPQLLADPVPWHGTIGFFDGGFNAIDSTASDFIDDTLYPRPALNVIPGTSNMSVLSAEGSAPLWRIDRGTSWHFGLSFDDNGPVAVGLLVYSQSSNPNSPYFNDQALLYSAKEGRPLLFNETDIQANLIDGASRDITGDRIQ